MAAATSPKHATGFLAVQRTRAHLTRAVLRQLRCLSASADLRSQHSASLPDEAWDTHIHVTDPSKHKPSGKGQYKVHAATLPQAVQHAKRLKIPNVCFVQTSTYGTDNTWIVDCLEEVRRDYGNEHKARGIIDIDPNDKPSVSAEALDAYHTAGVRGVRINLVSVRAAPTPDELSRMLRQHADVIRPLKSWSLDLHVQLDLVPQILRLADDLCGQGDLKLCLGHLAYPPLGADGERWRHAGWRELLDLLHMESAFVKVSAPYRLSRSHLMARGELGLVGRDGEKDGWLAAEHAVKDVLGARDGRAAVFASDWPHTRFEGLDVTGWRDNCVRWAAEAGGQVLVDNLFRDNARILLDV